MEAFLVLHVQALPPHQTGRNRTASFPPLPGRCEHGKVWRGKKKMLICMLQASTSKSAALSLPPSLSSLCYPHQLAPTVCHGGPCNSCSFADPRSMQSKYKLPDSFSKLQSKSTYLVLSSGWANHVTKIEVAEPLGWNDNTMMDRRK